MTKKPAAHVSWVLLIVLVAALATGAAASILVAATTAPPPPAGTETLVYLPEWALTAISFGIIFLVVGSFVIWRLASGPSSTLNRMAVSILAIVLAGVLFVAGARLMGAGGGLDFGGSSPTGCNNCTTQQGNNTTHGTLTGPGGVISLFPGVPGWVPFAVLGAIVLLAVVVAVPQTRRYLSERRESAAARRRHAASVPTGMRQALSRASTELDLGGDPRTVILALYARMLEELRPMVDDLPTSTPEEIRATHLVRLGVRPEAARTLTRLFEEARYSTHPMGPAERTRAQDAVRATLDDLTRRTLDA